MLFISTACNSFNICKIVIVPLLYRMLSAGLYKSYRDEIVAVKWFSLYTKALLVKLLKCHGGPPTCVTRHAPLIAELRLAI